MLLSSGALGEAGSQTWVALGGGLSLMGRMLRIFNEPGAAGWGGGVGNLIVKPLANALNCWAFWVLPF